MSALTNVYAKLGLCVSMCINIHLLRFAICLPLLLFCDLFTHQWKKILWELSPSACVFHLPKWFGIISNCGHLSALPQLQSVNESTFNTNAILPSIGQWPNWNFKCKFCTEVQKYLPLMKLQSAQVLILFKSGPLGNAGKSQTIVLLQLFINNSGSVLLSLVLSYNSLNR